MAFDKENKLIYEDLSPSLQDLLKNKVTTKDLLALFDKLEKVNKNLSFNLSNYIRKTEIWQALHIKFNYTPTDTTNVGWNSLGFCIINYNIDGRIKHQPSQRGQLFNIPMGEPGTSQTESTQLWIDQPSGVIRFRGGDQNNPINEQPFTSLMANESWPVGSIYMTALSGNPASKIGYGVWVQIKGAYLYATDTNYGDIDPLNRREGSNSIKIETENLPRHSFKGTTNDDGGHTHTRGTMNITGFCASFPWTTDNMFASPSKNNTWGGTGPTGAFYGAGWARTGRKDGREGPSVAFDASRSWTGETSVSKHSHTFSTEAVGGDRPIDIKPYRIPLYVWYRKA